MLRFDDRSPDARTVEMLISPYREIITVDDGAGPYEEEFLPGAFREQVEEAESRPLRIWLNLEHRKEHVIGHAARLVEHDGGLYGAFGIRTGVAGDKVLAAVREGVLSGVSMQATPLRSRNLDGVTQRMKACLMGVALVPEPAYLNAQVLGVRKAWRDDQPGPASADEVHLWELERLEGKLRALAASYIDEFVDEKQLKRRLVRLGVRRVAPAPRSYTGDPRYQRVLRVQAQIKEQRAEIERRLQPDRGSEATTPADALRPKVLRRRVLSGPITIR